MTREIGQRLLTPLGAMAVGVLPLLVLLGATVAQAQEDDPGPSCPTTPAAPLAESPDSPLTLSITNPEPFHFGRTTNVEVFRIPFDAGEPIPQPEVPLSVTVSDFRRDTGGRLSLDRVVVSSEIRRSTGFLALCIDPTGGNWGSYDGVITVDDARFEVTAVPVSLAIQYNLLVVVATVALLAAIAAVIFKYAESQKTSDRRITGGTPWSRFRDWCARRPIALASAAVATGSVFLAQYWADATWDGDLQRFGVLVGAVFSAVVATLSAGELIAPAKDE